MEKKRIVKEYVQPILMAILIALLVRTFFVQAFRIPSGSMEPTLLIGDYLLVNKFIYGIRIPFADRELFPYQKPQRGDVIVFVFPLDPSKDFIKRVIGIGGEKVQIIENKIYIDDQRIDDPWGYFNKTGSTESFPMMKNFGPVIIPKDSLFVLGDNRNNSDDSRFWGFVPLHAVVGKAFDIYFSWNSRAENVWDKVRWSRIGEWIH